MTFTFHLRAKEGDRDGGVEKSWLASPDLLGGAVLLFFVPAVCTLVILIPFHFHYCVKRKRESKSAGIAGSPYVFTHVYLIPLFHEQKKINTRQ